MLVMIVPTTIITSMRSIGLLALPARTHERNLRDLFKVVSPLPRPIKPSDAQLRSE
jgi:hypothetical protein